MKPSRSYTNGLIIIFLIVLFGLSSLKNLTYAFPPDNQWKNLVTQECIDDTNKCKKNINLPTTQDAKELRGCITCCLGDPHTAGEICFNHCICECSIRSNPNGPNTMKLCTIPPKNQQGAALNPNPLTAPIVHLISIPSIETTESIVPALNPSEEPVAAPAP